MVKKNKLYEIETEALGIIYRFTDLFLFCGDIMMTRTNFFGRSTCQNIAKNVTRVFPVCER